MTLLGALAILLGRHAGQSDLSIGTSIANRTRPETEGLIGFFINNLVLRVDLSGAPRSARSSRGCGRRAFGPMLTRTCPSNASWRS